MLINLKFFSVNQAGREALRRQIEIDEANLPDYPRPLKEMKETRLTPFQSNVVRYGIGSALFRTIAP